MDQQLAQAAGGGATSAPIGRVDTIKGTVAATHLDGTKVVLAKGDPVYLKDIAQKFDVLDELKSAWMEAKKQLTS